MTHGTEEKILNAALKEFAEYGYAGAKTKTIAERSGLSEMTLFRRFKSKRNLFNQVLLKNQEEIIKKYGNIMEYQKSEDPHEYFRHLTTKLWELTEENFEFLSIIILEKQQISEDINAEMISNLTEIFNKAFPDSRIDSKVLIISILSFIYTSVLDKRMGRNIIYKKDFEEFVEFILNSLQSS